MEFGGRTCEHKRSIILDYISVCVLAAEFETRITRKDTLLDGHTSDIEQ